MKTNRTIYLLLIIVGAVVMSMADKFPQKEYGLIAGLVLLMFGIYKTSRSWSQNREDTFKEEE